MKQQRPHAARSFNITFSTKIPHFVAHFREYFTKPGHLPLPSILTFSDNNVSRAFGWNHKTTDRGMRERSFVIEGWRTDW